MNRIEREEVKWKAKQIATELSSIPILSDRDRYAFASIIAKTYDKDLKEILEKIKSCSGYLKQARHKGQVYAYIKGALSKNKSIKDEL